MSKYAKVKGERKKKSKGKPLKNPRFELLGESNARTRNSASRTHCFAERRHVDVVVLVVGVVTAQLQDHIAEV